jgi:hypothetical protein
MHLDYGGNAAWQGEKERGSHPRDQRHRPRQILPRQAGGMEAADGTGDGDRADQGQRHAQYEIFFNADESEAIVFERYRDADAALEHFANIGHLMAPLMETATVTGELLGTPNAQIRANLTGDQPKLFEPWMTIDEG